MTGVRSQAVELLFLLHHSNASRSKDEEQQRKEKKRRNKNEREEYGVSGVENILSLQNLSEVPITCVHINSL